ncbi:MAG TPA: alkaline phosphatase family protein [Micrococcaceae bacterium]|nr:alkaline phosphatase family protein [Micrococcaceae bacterium]
MTSSPDCQANDVNFDQLAGDLASVQTTPNLSYITPNLCNDGHDSPCADGRPGGLVSADAWLKQQVPMIMDSPAFKQDGMLVITFDEAEGNAAGPASGIPGGTAGGRIGALVLSPQVRGGTSSDRLYNLLAAVPGLCRGARAEPLRFRCLQSSVAARIRRLRAFCDGTTFLWQRPPPARDLGKNPP